MQLKCSEIIAGAKGIYIHNSETNEVIIDSDYIEGNGDGDGAISSVGTSKYLIRNAKIKNVDDTSSSIGIFINISGGYPNITLENVVVVTGSLANGETIYSDVGVSITYVNNYGVFLNKDASNIEFIIGDSGNYKVIVDNEIE